MYSIAQRVLIFSFVCVFICSLNAQENTDTALLLPSFNITESRLAISYKESARHVDIISQDYIANSNARSVAELLQLNTGIDIRRRGPHGVQSDVGIRGGNFAQVLVMVNGVKMIDPQTAHHVMNLPIDVEAIERIEVLKGPAARKFGQNAFAGAINIVTKRPEEDFVKIALQIAENSTQQLGISGAYNTDNSSHYIAASQAKSDGYRENTDYKINRLYYQSNVALSKVADLDIQGGITQRKFGANGFYASPDFTDQYEEVSTGYLALSSTLLLNNTVIKPQVYYRENHDDYVFLRQDPAFFNNVHTGKTLGAEINTQHFSSWGTTGWGVMLSRESLSSNNLGNRERDIFGFNLEHQLRIFSDKLKISPGIFINKFSDREVRIFPGIDVSYSIQDDIDLFSNFSTASRVPTYTNLYYSSPRELGNADLSDEEIKQYEAGIKIKKNHWQLTSTIFSNQTIDLIDWIRDTTQEETIWQSTNIAGLDQQGVDVSLRMNLGHFIGLSGLHTTIGYMYINSERPDDPSGFESRYTIESLKHQLTANFLYNINKYLNYSINYRYADRENLESYGVLDTRLSLEYKEINIYLQADNIFNTSYRETNLVEMPGRWIGMGASYTIGL